MIIRIIPLIFSFIILGAHFLRGGNYEITLVFILIPLLLLIKKSWSFLLVQYLAYTGALVWVYTAFELIRQRMALGAPWLRMVLILGVVSLFTAWSGILLNSKIVRNKYIFK